tara:strand:- start:1336 stop:1938 length:603 start_codon:yes stop_codon:yes gene_type:complete
VAELENLEKLVAQINGWASSSGKPVSSTANYASVYEEEKEEGTFSGVGGKSSKIDGYIVSEKKSGGNIVWDLPGSLDNFLVVLEQIEWIESEDETNIDYDDINFGGTEKSSSAFDDNDKEITEYDEFEGDGEIEVIHLQSKYKPTEITITYENDQKVVFDRTGTDNWTVKIADGNTENVPDYQAALLLIRTLLGLRPFTA